ncbi:Phosphoribosylformylglycinamidine cyclo-ligase, chloroplastic/mitochondrial [Vitis vinifera]|uniref:phosphoribosylformylglycinamidine cyclo-ligase n=1 Tax=Vitis vinifera TaxID=29760 RepID=A0A438FID0_VITVI|nr:Phosphoribosylformylglycinamidine cyclo-ligase, chloroplastic/mitochondrial [Vitis vinifera]
MSSSISYFLVTMTSSLRANIELSRCFAYSGRPCDQKAYVTQQHPCKGTENCFSKRFSLLRMAAGEVRPRRPRRPRNTSLISSMSKNNYGESADMADSLTYKDAGVDIDAGSELVKRIAKMAPGIGGFGGLFPLGTGIVRVIIEATMVVLIVELLGPKDLAMVLRDSGGDLAFETGIHETIGIDLVAMSVNDIVTSGAKPLFFLDYFATSHLDVDLAEKVIKGIVDGCQQSDCVLLGGERKGNTGFNSLTTVIPMRSNSYKAVCGAMQLEGDAYQQARLSSLDCIFQTAEMPDFYADGEYDLSGFAVGVVKKDSVIDGKTIVPGDVLIGLPSSGVHSNGFSLVRRVLSKSGLSLKGQLPGEAITLGEALMAPTIIYVKQVLDFISKGGVKGIAHITGGGFTDNIPRVFPKGLGAVIYKDSWEVPSVFKWIQEAGRIEDAEMRRTFNMGIGMVLVVSPEASSRILGDGNGAYTAYKIGEVASDEGISGPDFILLFLWFPPEFAAFLFMLHWTSALSPPAASAMEPPTNRPVRLCHSVSFSFFSRSISLLAELTILLPELLCCPCRCRCHCPCCAAPLEGQPLANSYHFLHDHQQMVAYSHE